MDKTNKTDADDGHIPQEEWHDAMRHLFDARGHTGHVRHAFDALPDETRISRVATIYDIGGKPFKPTTRLISVAGIGRVEKGMYIVVPANFPARCDIRLSERAFYAVAKVEGECHKFIVWPDSSAEGVQAEYDHQRPSLRGYPEEIGRVYRPLGEVPEAQGAGPRRGEAAIPREWRNRIPRGIARCSCGTQTHIMFVEPDGDPNNGRYEADSPRWKFREESEAGLPTGWYCGTEGHHLADYTKLQTRHAPELQTT